MKKSFVNREASYEKKYRASIAKALDAQVKPFTEWLSEQPVLTESTAQVFMLVREEVVSDPIGRMMETIAMREAALMELEMKELVKKKAAKIPRYRKTAKRFVKEKAKPLHDQIAGASRKRINDLIGKALEKKMTAKQAASFVDKEMKRARDYRAKRIVRTEVSRAMNFGRLMGVLQTGYKVRKKWAATLDHKTRHTHRKLNGTTKKMTEPFNTENGAIWMPHDPNAPAEETVNCRCSLTYVPYVRKGEPVMMSKDELLSIYTSGDASARLIINEMISANIL